MFFYLNRWRLDMVEQSFTQKINKGEVNIKIHHVIYIVSCDFNSEGYNIT